MTDDPRRDSELADFLRRLDGDPPFDAIDWEQLRGRISARAKLPLARLRRGVAWWNYTARWARAAIPLAAAAVLAVVVTFPNAFRSDMQTQQSRAAASILEREGLALAVTGDVPEREVFDAVVGPTDKDWLLEAVMEGGER